MQKVLALKKTFIVLLLLVSSAYFVFFTNTSVQIFSNLMVKFIPGELQIGRIHGRLISDLYLKNIVYTQPNGMKLTIQSLQLNYDLRPLLRGVFKINVLTAKDVHMIMATRASTKQTSFDVKTILHQMAWLKYISIQKLDVPNIMISNQIAKDAIRAAITGNLNHDGQISWHIEAPHVNVLLPDAKGSFVSNGKISDLGQNPKVTAQFKLQDFSFQNVMVHHALAMVNSSSALQAAHLNIQLNDLSVSDYKLKESHLHADAKMIEKDLELNIAADFGDGNSGKGKVILPYFSKFSTQKQKIDGEMVVTLHSFKNLLPETYVQHVKGSVMSQILLQGTFAHPQLKINSEIKDGSVFVPELQTTISAIHVQSQYVNNQALNFSGGFKAGAGEGVFKGVWSLHEKNLPLQLSLTGEALTLINSPEYKIKISPDLKLNYQNHLFNIQGNVLIPYAEINRGKASQITHLPDEVVFIHSAQAQKTQNLPQQMLLDIKVTLGKNIHIAYDQLQTELQGQAHITQNQGNMPIASGELHTVHGRYEAYGKQLKIERGRLIYAGNLITNPGLDIRASKTFDTVGIEEGKSQFSGHSDEGLKTAYKGAEKLIVGVQVTGTLQQPRLNLFSDPAGMKQNDILSYLVFGYPQSHIDKSSSLAVLNQLASMNNVGGKSTDITKTVKNTLGLSELSLGETDYFDTEKGEVKSATTMNVGKKIGKHLEIKYKVGLFNTLNVLTLKYKITKHLSLQTETNPADTGADLTYEFERD